MEDIKKLFENPSSNIFIIDGMTDVGGNSLNSIELAKTIFEDYKKKYGTDEFITDDVINYCNNDKSFDLNSVISKIIHNNVEKKERKEFNFLTEGLASISNKIMNLQFDFNKLSYDVLMLKNKFVTENFECRYFCLRVSEHVIGIMIGKNLKDNKYFVVVFNTGLGTSYAKVKTDYISGMIYFYDIKIEYLNKFIKSLGIYGLSLEEINSKSDIVDFYNTNISILVRSEQIVLLKNKISGGKFLFENIKFNDVKNSFIKILFMEPQYSGNCSFLWILNFPLMVYFLKNQQLLNNVNSSINIVNNFNLKCDEIRLDYYTKLLNYIYEKREIEFNNMYVIDLLFIIENNSKKYNSKYKQNESINNKVSLILHLIQSINDKIIMNINIYERKNSKINHVKDEIINISLEKILPIKIESTQIVLDDSDSIIPFYIKIIDNLYDLSKNTILFNYFFRKNAIDLLNYTYKTIITEHKEVSLDLIEKFNSKNESLQSILISKSDSNVFYTMIFKYIYILIMYRNFNNSNEDYQPNKYKINLNLKEEHQNIFDIFFASFNIYDNNDIGLIEKLKELCKEIGALIYFEMYFIKYIIKENSNYSLFDQKEIISVLAQENLNDKFKQMFDSFNSNEILYLNNDSVEIKIQKTTDFIFTTQNEPYQFVKDILLFIIHNKRFFSEQKDSSGKEFIESLDKTIFGMKCFKIDLMTKLFSSARDTYNCLKKFLLYEGQQHKLIKTAISVEKFYNNDNIIKITEIISNFIKNEKVNNIDDIDEIFLKYCHFFIEYSTYYPIIFDKNNNEFSFFKKTPYYNIIKNLILTINDNSVIKTDLYSLFILFLCVYLLNNIDISFLNENKENIEKYLDNYKKNVMEIIKKNKISINYIYSLLYITIITLTLNIKIKEKNNVLNEIYLYNFMQGRKKKTKHLDMLMDILERIIVRFDDNEFLNIDDTYLKTEDGINLMNVKRSVPDILDIYESDIKIIRTNKISFDIKEPNKFTHEPHKIYEFIKSLNSSMIPFYRNRNDIFYVRDKEIIFGNYKFVNIYDDIYVAFIFFTITGNSYCWLPIFYVDLASNIIIEYHFKNNFLYFHNSQKNKYVFYDIDIKLKLLDCGLNYFVEKCEYSKKEKEFEIITNDNKKYFLDKKTLIITKKENNKIYKLIFFDELMDKTDCKLLYLWNFFMKNSFYDDIFIWESDDILLFEFKNYMFTIYYNTKTEDLYFDDNTKIFIYDENFGLLTKNINDIDKIYISRFLNCSNVALLRYNNNIYKLQMFNFPFVAKNYFYEKFTGKEKYIKIHRQKYSIYITIDRTIQQKSYKIDIDGLLNVKTLSLEQEMIYLLNFKNLYNFDILQQIFNNFYKYKSSSDEKYNNILSTMFYYLYIINRKKDRFIDYLSFDFLIQKFVKLGIFENKKIRLINQMCTIGLRFPYEDLNYKKYCDEVSYLFNNISYKITEESCLLDKLEKNNIEYNRLLEIKKSKNMNIEFIDLINSYISSFMSKDIRYLSFLVFLLPHDISYLNHELNNFFSEFIFNVSISYTFTIYIFNEFSKIDDEIDDETKQKLNDAIIEKKLFIFPDKISLEEKKLVQKFLRFKLLIVFCIYTITFNDAIYTQILESNGYLEPLIYKNYHDFSNIKNNYQNYIDEEHMNIIDNKSLLLSPSEQINLEEKNLNIMNYEDNIKTEIINFVNTLTDKKTLLNTYKINKINLKEIMTEFNEKIKMIQQMKFNILKEFNISEKYNLLVNAFRKHDNTHIYDKLRILNIMYLFYVKNYNELSQYKNIEKIDITNIVNEYNFIKDHLGKETLNILFYFEVVSGLLLNNEQNDFLMNEMKNIHVGTNYFKEILMGKGKSSVILPLISIFEYLINGNRVIIVLPINLVEQTYNFIRSVIHPYFNVCIGKNTLMNDICVCSCEYLREVFISIFSDSGYENLYKLQFDFNFLKKYNDCVYLFDEIHLICDPTNCETNIIINEKNVIKDISPTNMTYFIYSSIFNLVYNLFFNDEFNFPNIMKISHKNFTEFDFDNLMKNNKSLIIDLLKKSIYNYNNFKDYNLIFEDYDGSVLFSNFLETKIKENYSKIKDTTILKYFNFIYHIFYNVIPSICNMYNKKDFGLINVENYNNKNKFIICPFSSFETPSYGSEFSDYNISMILSVISYFHDSIRTIDLNNLLEHYIDKIKNDVNTDFYLEKINTLFNIPYNIKIGINEIINGTYTNYVIVFENVKKINDDEKLKYKFLKEYIIGYIFPKYYSKITFEQINFTNFDIMSEYIAKNIKGFTGTLHNVHKPICYTPNNEISIHTRKNIYGEICVGLGNILEKNEPTIYKINDESDLLEQIIIYLLKKKYDALIDASGLLINYDTLVIIDRIYVMLNKNEYYKNTFCYVFILNDIKYVYHGGMNYSIFENNPCSIDNLFVFYSNSYITGIDFKFNDYAKALLTVSKTITFDTLSQSGYRMRRLNPIGHQMIDYVVLNNLNINSFSDIVKFTMKNEEVDKNMKYNTFNYQTLKSLVRNDKIMLYKYERTLVEKGISTDHQKYIMSEFYGVNANKDKIDEVNKIFDTTININEKKYKKHFIEAHDNYHDLFKYLNETYVYNDILKYKKYFDKNDRSITLIKNTVISSQKEKEKEKQLQLTKKSNSIFKQVKIESVRFKNSITFNNTIQFCGLTLDNKNILSYDKLVLKKEPYLEKYNSVLKYNVILNNNFFLSPYLYYNVSNKNYVEQKIFIKNILNPFIILININNDIYTSIIISLEEFLFINNNEINIEFTGELYAIDINSNIFKYNKNNFELCDLNYKLRNNSYITLFLLLTNNDIEIDRIINMFFKFKFDNEGIEYVKQNIVSETINQAVMDNILYSKIEKINKLSSLKKYTFIKEEIKEFEKKINEPKETIDNIISISEEAPYTLSLTISEEMINNIINSLLVNFTKINEEKTISSLTNYKYKDMEFKTKDLLELLLCVDKECSYDNENIEQINMYHNFKKTINYYKTKKPKESTEKPKESTEKPKESTEKPKESTEKPKESTEKPKTGGYYKKYIKYKLKYLQLVKQKKIIYKKI